MKYYFYVGGGGNGINFLASLATYNILQDNSLIEYHPRGHSHFYIEKYGHLAQVSVVSDISMLSSSASDFKFINIFDKTILDSKIRALNHYLKIFKYAPINAMFANTCYWGLYRNSSFYDPNIKSLEELSVEQEMQLLTLLLRRDAGIDPGNSIDMNPTALYKVAFDDILNNKQKIIKFIEELTGKASNHMLSENYDRYLELQHKLIKPYESLLK